MYNLELKAEIVRHYGSQIEASKVLGIHVTRISHIIHGYIQPSKRDRKALELALGQRLATKLLRLNKPTKRNRLNLVTKVGP